MNFIFKFFVADDNVLGLAVLTMFGICSLVGACAFCFRRKRFEVSFSCDAMEETVAYCLFQRNEWPQIVN